MENGRAGALVLGVDLEGVNVDLADGGVDRERDRVMEIGAVLWDAGRRQPVRFFSHLIDEEGRPPITAELTELTGIDDGMLARWGLSGERLKGALGELAGLMGEADHLMAHSGTRYDLPMLGALYERHGLRMPEKTWIDSSQDIEYPRAVKGRGLAALEHAHGFVNPFPHRAVTDVLSMLRVASGYPLERMVRLARSPKVRVVAKFGPPDWKDPESVRKFNAVKRRVSRARFQWNPDRRVWSKDVHKVLLDEGGLRYDFEWGVEDDRRLPA